MKELMKITAVEISEVTSRLIIEWHREQLKRTDDYVIVTENVKRRREFNSYRDDIWDVIKELIYTNCEIWHEEDKVRSEKDDVVLKAIRNINPLNQHRNDLIEEIDEIICASKKEI